MKVAIEVIITDTHLTPYNQEANFQAYQGAFNLAKSLGLKRVLHAGDVFESRKAQPQDNLNFFEDILDDVFSKEIQLWAIPGNHDKVSYTSKRSYLDPFKHHPHFRLFRERTMVNAGGHFLSFMPFFRETDTLIPIIEGMESMVSAVKDANSAMKVVGIGHFGINGVMNNDGTLVDNPIVPDLFSDFDIVLMGHYHDASHIQPNIYYPGASIQHKFGEKGAKGIHVLYDDMTFDTHVVENSHSYQTVDIDIVEHSIDSVRKIVESSKDPNITYRFNLIGPADTLRAYDTTFIVNAGIKVKKVSPETIIDDDDELEEIFISSQKILEEWDIFCKLRDYPETVCSTGKKFLLKN
jgi:exonuclease SbcD